jgi:hypothetical protein
MAGHAPGPVVAIAVPTRCPGAARAPAALRVLVIAFAGVMVASLAALPAGAKGLPPSPAAQLHKAKRLKVLPTLSGVKQASATKQQSSPYARAAAQRAESGLPPPGHAHMRQRSAPDAGRTPN